MQADAREVFTKEVYAHKRTLKYSMSPGIFRQGIMAQCRALEVCVSEFSWLLQGKTMPIIESMCLHSVHPLLPTPSHPKTQHVTSLIINPVEKGAVHGPCEHIQHWQ